FASNEAQLSNELHSAVYEALRGDYSTSPPTVATTSGSTFAGDVALLSSTEFPSWRGHLRAYDIVHVDSQGNPSLLWDAGRQLAAKAWNARRVYTSNPSSGHALVPLLDSGGNPNGNQVQPLGLGASVAEANSIIPFILGNGRDWPMGSLLNSTPV